jgi:hypothetical protein
MKPGPVREDKSARVQTKPGALSSQTIERRLKGDFLPLLARRNLTFDRMI